jgi:hypothetical protein
MVGLGLSIVYTSLENASFYVAVQVCEFSEIRLSNIFSNWRDQPPKVPISMTPLRGVGLSYYRGPPSARAPTSFQGSMRRAPRDLEI